MLQCFAVVCIQCSCFPADSNNEETPNSNGGEPMEMDAEQFEDADD